LHIPSGVSGNRRWILVVGVLLAFVDLAHGQGNYQRTRNGKTLVWNDHPKAGDVATWSGGRDRDGYARGFGTLIWYTKEANAEKAQLFARYWGNMTQGKLNGAVNVHSKKKTHHAIFADGARLTRWAPGPALSRMTPQQTALIAKHNATVAEALEPESPAQGPAPAEATSDRPPAGPGSESRESVRDLWSERWPKIDIDDSLRLLAWPPRSLRK
jgi:hypothetical protein